ncbi:MAG TPA: inorganic phosphate transporter [Candidatus Acidoferrales bacterium]|nr:inorganic phosphate transporter [Candidatus Acidoferrales bacterium]
MAFVAGNNLSACVGTIVGARILGRQAAKVFATLGIAVGLLLQGHFMAYTIQAIFPVENTLITAGILFLTVVAFTLAKAMRAPLSLSMALVALLLGLSTSHNLPTNYVYTRSVIAMWLIAPVSALVFGFAFLRVIDRIQIENVWRRIATYKFLQIALSFFAAFVLGANTIGLVVALAGFEPSTMLTAIVAIIIGSMLFSDGELRRVGQEFFSMRYANSLAALFVSTLFVELATFFAIPLSSTQALSAGILGTGTSYRVKLVSLRPFLVIVIAWVIVPTLSFAVGYLF